jgi:hypothetical protein
LIHIQIDLNELQASVEAAERLQAKRHVQLREVIKVAHEVQMSASRSSEARDKELERIALGSALSSKSRDEALLQITRTVQERQVSIEDLIRLEHSTLTQEMRNFRIELLDGQEKSTMRNQRVYEHGARVGFVLLRSSS